MSSKIAKDGHWRGAGRYEPGKSGNPAGRKIAGAGQRRTTRGLLHQGSVASSPPVAESLAAALALEVVSPAICPPETVIAAIAAERYASVEWTSRR